MHWLVQSGEMGLLVEVRLGRSLLPPAKGHAQLWVAVTSVCQQL